MSEEEVEFKLAEENRGIPKSSVEKLVKELMPPNVKCAPETRQLIAECCLEFLHMVTSEANDVQTQDNKKLMSVDHVVKALENLGFAHYLDEAKTVLEQSKAVEKTRPNLATKLKNSGLTQAELAAQQKELLAKAKLAYQERMRLAKDQEKSTQQEQRGEDLMKMEVDEKEDKGK